MELVKGLELGLASHRLARSESGFWELCDAEEAAGWQELAAAVLAPPTDSEGEEPTALHNTDNNTASGARSDSSLDKAGDGCAATGQLKDLLALNQPGGPYPFFQMQRGREPRRAALDGCGADAFKSLFPGECSWLAGAGASDSDSEGCRAQPAEPQEPMGAPLPPPTLSNRLCLNAQDVIRSWERQGVPSRGGAASAQAATPRPGPPHQEALGGCARRAARAANVLAGAPSAAGAPRGLPFSRALLFAAAARTPPPACAGATACARSRGHAGGNGCVSGAGGGPGCLPHEGGDSRLLRVARYLHKRRSRPFITKVRYQVRKANAEARPRFKGRFVKNGEDIPLDWLD